MSMFNFVIMLLVASDGSSSGDDVLQICKPNFAVLVSNSEVCQRLAACMEGFKMSNRLKDWRSETGKSSINIFLPYLFLPLAILVTAKQ
ncbi:hypothetical protein vseg_015797 [Gypsophila vaccaria]